MTVREYIGARYVPLFLGEWDNTISYEPLSVVSYQGNSYTSRQYVPIGISINDNIYWAETGNYNAQVEAYRQEVFTFDDRITSNANNISDINDALDIINSNEWVTTQRIDDEAVTSSKLADDSVTTDKIADNSVTTDKIAALSINGTKIADGSISGTKIADGTIGYSDITENLKQRIKDKSISSCNVICIGDSYGRGVGGTDDHGWPYYLNSSCSFNYMLNVSNSGAGFVANGHSTPYGSINFEGQIEWAYSHLPENISNNDINLIIIGGNFNDNQSSGIADAARSCVIKGKQLFPNAKIVYFPIIAPDANLSAVMRHAYVDGVYGCASGGAQVFSESFYWLFPYENQCKYGDNIHPNNQGYLYIGRFMAGCVDGGYYEPTTFNWATATEGYSLAQGASAIDFRAGVINGVAFYGGQINRTGFGELCTLPTYCRNRSTKYVLAFAYADTDHHGIARIRLDQYGIVNFYALETGTYDESKTWQIFIPFTVIPLGHIA